MEHIAGPRFAGTISWFLILGYVFTISLYAYTFGAYAGRLFGLGSGPNLFLAGAIIVLITVLNLSGVRSSGVSEDILVYGKILILTGLIGLGFYMVHPEEILPIVNRDPNSIIFGAALVFVAYEGFQLLTYDYDDIENHKVNLPRAVISSIIAVIVLYMLIAFVLTGSLGSDVIARHKETALALIAEPLLGRTGIVIVLVAAVFSTSSAILATIFALARLAKRIARDGQLPHQLADRVSGGVPVYFTLLTAFFAIVIQIFGNLHQITTFSSLIFLFVFTVVNYMGYRTGIFEGRKQSIPILGCIGCAGAMGVLIYDTYLTEPNVLYLVLGISVALIVSRLLFTWLHSNYKGRAS